MSQSGDQRLECSCHTSRGSARRSAEHAGRWIYRQSSLPRIPSGNSSHNEWKTGNDGCEGRCVLNSLAATYVGETLKVCMAEHKWVVKRLQAINWQNHHACPKGRSKELMGGRIPGVEGFLKKP